MIECKVIQYILCKLDGREYQVGDVYTGTQDRIDELIELGYLVAQEQKTITKKTVKK